MLQEIDIIDFENKKYKCRIIDLNEEFGKVYVGSTELEKKLITEEGGYTSEMARFVDEQIFYFVDAWKFRLTDDLLAQSILADL